MTRIPVLAREELNEEQAALYREIESVRVSGAFRRSGESWPDGP